MANNIIIDMDTAVILVLSGDSGTQTTVYPDEDTALTDLRRIIIDGLEEDDRAEWQRHDPRKDWMLEQHNQLATYDDMVDALYWAWEMDAALTPFCFVAEERREA